MTFDGEYPITGITCGDDKIIYLNKEDYVNFLGVYNKIGFSDGEEIFFKDLRFGFVYGRDSAVRR